MKQVTKTQLEDIVEYISDNIGGYIYNSAAQNIAPMEATTTTSREYKVGEQFYYDKILYAATAPIANGGTIVTSGANKNCEPSPTLTEQLADLGTSAYKNSTSAVTDSSDLVESGAVKDIVGWGNKNLLKVTADTLKALNGGANTWTGNTKVINNVTWEIQTDGDLVTGIKASGTNGNSTLLFNIITQEFGLSNFSSADNTSDDYFASTGLSGDANDTYKLQHQGDNNANYIRVQANYAFGSGGVIFKPMICRKNLIDKSFEPYHASVEESLDGKLSYADNTVLGCKNLSPILFSNVSGTPNALYQLINSGIRVYTAISDSYQRVYITLDNLPQNTDIKISSDITYVSGVARIGVQGYKNGTWTDITFPQGVTQSGKWVDTFNTGDYSQWKVWLYITALTSEVGDVTYGKLMFRLATDTDPTFAPYSKTNVQLTQDKAENSVIAPTENGTTVSQAYAVGSHAIRNGKFITWKNAKAQGEPINDASDYDIGDVADELTKVVSSATTSNAKVTLDSSKNFVLKRNSVLFFEIEITISEAITGNETLLTLPFLPYLSPTMSIRVPLYTYDRSFVDLVYLNSSGEIHSYSSANLSTGVYILEGTFIAK